MNDATQPIPGPALDQTLLARVLAATDSPDAPRFWCKVVDMLQQNWAIVLDGTPCVIVFHDDLRGIFDARRAHDRLVAAQQLTQNDFEPHVSGGFPSPPTGTWHLRTHPSGRIYATGRFWRT